MSENRRRIRALIVDDERLMRYLIEQMLQKLGLETLSAAGGEEALEIFLTGKPDIVFSDIMMPDIDGTELYHRIKEINPEVPVALMSAVEEYAEGVEPEGLIQKPVSEDKLLTILRRYFPGYEFK